MKINIEKIKKKKSIKELLEFGIINIDKPLGPTSFDISDFVRKMLSEFGVHKTSHFGTLDPKVTGILPIALNRACKLTGFFLGEDKEYMGIMRVHEDLPLAKIRKMIKEKFTGIIIQKPPVKSRVKRQNREREIKSFDLIEKDEKDILFRTEVQGGTYIRKLIDDLGKALGIGAHMLELRRIRAGIFKEDDKKYPSSTLYDLEKAIKSLSEGNEEEIREIIVPAEIVSDVYKIVEIKEDYVRDTFLGRPILKEAVKTKGKWEREEKVSVFSGERFIGMFKVLGLEDSDIFAKAEFVLQPIK